MLVKVWRKRSPWTLLVGMETIKYGAVVENSMTVSIIKLKTTLLYDPVTHLWGHISKGNEIMVSKRYLHSCVHYSIVYNGHYGIHPKI